MNLSCLNMDLRVLDRAVGEPKTFRVQASQHVIDFQHKTKHASAFNSESVQVSRIAVKVSAFKF